MENRYHNLGERARALLADGKERTTKGLAHELFAVSPEPVTTNQIMQGLKYLATHDLSDCAKRGEPVTERVRGRSGYWFTSTRRPWRWGLWGVRNSEAMGYCPHCGGKL